MLTLAMIDPTVGAGVLVMLLALFVVAPASFVSCLITRRWLVPSGLVTLAVSGLLALQWMWQLAFSTSGGWLNLRLLVFGIGLSLCSSLIAGLPGWAIGKGIARSRRRDSDRSGESN